MTAEEENRKHLDALLQSLLDLLPEEVVTKFHESLAETPDPTFDMISPSLAQHSRSYCTRCGANVQEQRIHAQWHRDLTSIVKAQGLVIGHIGFALHSLMEAFIATHPEVEDE